MSEQEDGSEVPHGVEDLAEAIRGARAPQFDFDQAANRLNDAANQASIAGHQWRQRGPHLVCVSCPHEHSTFIGMDKVLTGINERGEPMLERRRW